VSRVTCQCTHRRRFAQLEQRTELAKATHQIAVFTQGMIAMEKTLVGIKLLDPRVLLEEGIRKQLVLIISRALHNTLAFPQHRIEEFELKLQTLGNILDGFRRSFTCKWCFDTCHALPPVTH
jgi:WASH complex subunit strumpellin